MSLSGYFADIITGQPLGTSDAQTAAGDAADEQNVLINQQLAASGQLTPAQEAAIAEDYSTNADSNVGSAAVSGFDQSIGAQLSGQAGSGPVGDALSAVGTTISAGTTMIVIALVAVAGFIIWTAYKKK